MVNVNIEIPFGRIGNEFFEIAQITQDVHDDDFVLGN